MDFGICCKALLSIYKLLPALCDSIDKIVLARAIAPVTVADEGTFRQTNSVIALSSQKVNLINLKVLMDKTLAQMDENLARIIINHFIDGVKNDECAKRLGWSRREYFRKTKQALKSFQWGLLANLMTERKVYDEFFKGLFWQDTMERIGTFANSGGKVESCPDMICNLILKRLRRIL
ncbi:MAG: hypothetical protein ACI4L7_00260 [Christensenellales bacterium]